MRQRGWGRRFRAYHLLLLSLVSLPRSKMMSLLMLEDDGDASADVYAGDIIVVGYADAVYEANGVDANAAVEGAEAVGSDGVTPKSDEDR
jgi:hypothetical protein